MNSRPKIPKIDLFLEEMLSKHASDLHIVPNLRPKYRIYGELVDLDFPPIPSQSCTEYLLGLLDRAQKEDLFKHKDLDFLYVTPQGNRFRVNYFFQNQGLAAVFRSVPTKILNFEKLNLPSHLEHFAQIRSGLILFTGPTGAGKSTTLASLIHYINNRLRRHIITLENPIEFVHTSNRSIIHQREIGTHVASFEEGIIEASRQDPDIVLVGELIEPRVIRLTCSLAETGVLTLATLHTNSAAQTLDRIIDVFPVNQQPQIRAMLAQCLKGIFSQILLKTRDGTGRIPAYEVLFSSSPVANMIREGKVSEIQSYIQRSRSQGIVSLDSTLEQLLEKRKIHPEDAYMVAVDKTRFEKYLPSHSL
ncbi:MAG: PilT/PilU family type 4a pilus ATPase [Planctomycetota bacterium]|nr:MAG: PilT/PilU family type 4a pilus ATPase [Planctomycetota bacterium]